MYGDVQDGDNISGRTYAVAWPIFKPFKSCHDMACRYFSILLPPPPSSGLVSWPAAIRHNETLRRKTGGRPSGTGIGSSVGKKEDRCLTDSFADPLRHLWKFP